MSNDILVRVGADITDFSRKMGNASKTLSSFANSNKSAFASIGRVGDALTKFITVPAFAAAGALTGITLVKGFNRLVGIDTARAKLSALGHDAGSVENIMVNALDSVKGTSFGLDEAATIAASAVAAGIKPGKELTKYLTITGDAAAVAGTSLGDMGSIFNKVQTAQRAYTGDLNMLADRGLPIYEWIGDAAGKTADEVRDMAQSGQVSSEMFFDAVDKNIGGAAKVMGEKSFAAAVKNIGSDIARIGANFLDAGGEAGGFFSTVKPLLTEFRGFLESLEGSASKLGVKFGEAFIKIVNTLRNLKSTYDSLHPSIQKIVKVVTFLGAVFIVALGPILKLIAFIPKLVRGFQMVSKGFRVLRTVLSAARLALVGFSGPIGWITTAVIFLATVIFKYWTPIKGFFVNLWQSITNAFVSGYSAIDNATHGWLSNGMAVYKSFYNTGIELFKRYWEYVKDTFSNALDFLKALIRLDFAGMSDAIMTQTNLVKSFLGDSWKIIVDNMKQPLSNLYSSIRNTFTDIYNWLNVKTDGFFGAYTALWVGFFTAVVDVVKAGWALIRDTFSNTIEFLIGLATLDFGRMNDAIKDQTEVLKTFLTEIWTTIRDNIGEKLMDIVTLSIEKLTELKDNIVDKFVEIGESIAEWLMSMPEVIAEKLTLWGLAFAEWFVEQKDNIVEYLLGWAESIGEWFDTMPEVIYEKLIEWGRTIEEWFNEMPETIVSTLEGWRDAMVEWTERQDEENREQFGKWGETISEWFESIPGTIREKLEAWKTTISDKFSEMKETVSTKLSEWKETIIGWFDKQPGNIRSSLTQWWSTFGTWMSEIPGKITAKLEEWWEAFKTWFKELPNKPEVKNAGSDMIDKVGEGNEAQRADFTSKLGRLIIDVAKAALAMAAVALFAVGRELIRDLISGVQSMSSSLNAKFSELGRGIVTKISGFFSDMVTAGKSLIAGLINGIKQMSAQAIEAVTGVVNSVVKKAKSALKIKSPSRVFMEIGEFTGMGLVRGMDATNSAVERASERMTNAAIIDDPNIDMSYATPSGMRGTLSSAINGSVDVNSNGRDSALVGAINELRRDMTNMRIEMDGKQVGQVVEPHVTKTQNTRAFVRNKRR